MAVVIMHAPRWVTALAVGGFNRVFEQWVPARNTGIEYADRWRVGRWRCHATAELFGLFALIFGTHVDEDRGGLLGHAHLSHVAEYIN